MNDWKSCGNCAVFPLTNYCTAKTNTVICEYWKPMRCHCGGVLSAARFDKDGRPYRHCYACHVEVKLDGTRYSEDEIQKIIAGEGREID